MSTQMITNPPVLDTTGQAIVAALNNLTEATSPTNVYIDISLSIPVSGWDDNTPHVYTWMNENIVGNCGIEVGFADGAEDVATTFIRVTKIVGGIKFSIDEVPSAPIPLIVRIINAKADSVIGDIDATMVETSAISGVTNVEEALTDLDGRVDDNADDIASNSQAITKLQNGLAYIVGNTNTTGGTLAVGQFVYVKGHSTITEGLRTVTASISANGNITTSNTSACSDGGLNALNSNLTNIDHKNVFTYVVAFNKTQTSQGNWTDGGITFPVRPGDRVTMDVMATGTGQMTRSAVGSSGRIYYNDGPNISDYEHGGRFMAFTVLSNDSSITISSYANSGITVRTAVITVTSKY